MSSTGSQKNIRSEEIKHVEKKRVDEYTSDEQCILYAVMSAYNAIARAINPKNDLALDGPMQDAVNKNIGQIILDVQMFRKTLENRQEDAESKNEDNESEHNEYSESDSESEGNGITDQNDPNFEWGREGEEWHWVEE